MTQSFSDPQYAERRRLEGLDRPALAQLQLERLNALLARILPDNRFYARKLAGLRLPLRSLEELHELPYTFKEELAGQESAAGFAANITFPLQCYVRFHRTSGTRGQPLAVVDTPEDWRWWIDTWQFVLDVAEVATHDRVFMAFSFGPFIGFWSAYDAASVRGALVIPGGGMSSLARLQLMRSSEATVVCCTPSYALHLAEVARAHDIDLTTLAVRRIIVAGEPGGSLPALRERIESAWEARVIDHTGATEVGPWGYADPLRRGVHVIESEFLPEFRALESNRPARDGEMAELVITTLRRTGCPVIRYRSGDLVRPRWESGRDNRFVLLEGGVLGRADDMLIVRGVNVFPTAIEQILLGFPEVVEYRVTARKAGAMDALQIEVEDRLDQPERVALELQLRLGLKVEVTAVPLGSLPRFEAKARRFVDER